MAARDKKADTWMPLYIGDYLADTMHFSAAQHGAALLLMMQFWKTKAALPDEPHLLASTARCSLPTWNRVIGPVVLTTLFERTASGWISQKLRTWDYWTFGRLPRNEWLKLKALVFERDPHECVYCGAVSVLVVDHVVPLAQGGTNHINNLAIACAPCNGSKGAKMVSEWLS